MTKKTFSRNKSLQLLSKKSPNPIISEKHFANEVIDEAVEDLDVKTEVLDEQFDLPETAGLSRFGLNLSPHIDTPSLSPFSKPGFEIIDGLNIAPKEWGVDNLSGLTNSFGEPELSKESMSNAMRSLRGMASNGPSPSANTGTATSADSTSPVSNASSTAQNSYPNPNSNMRPASDNYNDDGTVNPSSTEHTTPNAVDAVCAAVSMAAPLTAPAAVYCAVRDAVQFGNTLGETAAMLLKEGTKEKIEASFGPPEQGLFDAAFPPLRDPSTWCGGEDRPGLEDRSLGGPVSATQVAQAMQKLRSWSDPSSTPGIDQDYDFLIGSASAPEQGVKNEKQGKWGSDDYYNDEGNFKVDSREILTAKNIGVNWGDEVLPVGGPTSAGTEGGSDGEPEPEPAVAAAADSFF